ncbi:MAG: Smr/MutS family protein [Holosporales bacterium]|nr:Smr/MutS family protein [Holosporales bacterium]
MKKTRHLSEEERTLWQAYVRSVTPCCCDKEETHISVAKEPPLPVISPRGQTRPKTLSPSAHLPMKLMPLTRKAQRSIRFTAQCDLHGHTIPIAFDVVQSFLSQAHAQNHKVVLIITGKGVNSSEKRETLRTLLPRWVEEPQLKQYVYQCAQASRRHGGEGAFYLFLKAT